ncbi:DUF6508 domain-containing protein [Dethiobacter alkaliphilus]|uniref:Uncharacterized protein n=1 Tax=Dethiobacter alkaliphilus AHT 1 TaxID=555088 RepID=C0GGX6_DETAL|nr:DUF6508 domain-containing protein [Dethiobacter alkaliphilus]EEG77278.1 conserved hypothetical protein [Dethiobacter alkaliphilus AHT 1]MCW3490172.1 DUF6508 domain-containing protein [Dethiobacter alkaliphilus]
MSVTKENLDRVLAYLPYFQDQETEKFEVSSVSMAGPYIYAEQVVKFLKTLHEEGLIIDFDWHGWGQESIRYFTDRELIESADLETVQKLFSTIVKAEKITNGVLAEMITKGVIVDLLLRLSQLRNEMQKG